MKLKSLKISMTRAEARAHEQYRGIPEHILESLYGYVNAGQHPGHFLSAVLSNDLFEAVGRGDSEALTALPLLVTFIHSRVPCACYQIHSKASRKALNRWMAWHRRGDTDVDLDEE